MCRLHLASLQQPNRLVTLPESGLLTDTSGVRAISDIYAECSAHKRPVVSVEFFPPKTPKGEESLYDRVLPRLAEAKPDFCSVTYGAGGSTRDKTLNVVDRIQRDFGFVGMAPLTCLATSATDILKYVNEANAKGSRIR